MMRVVKTDGLMPVGPHHRALLDGLDVDLLEETCLTEEAMIAACANADAILVLREPVSARVIGHLDRCKVISRFGVGLDTIDVSAATAAGIAVANVPDANIDEVSTHAMAFILSAVRRLAAFDRAVRSGSWDILAVGRGMQRTDRMTLGLVGFGQIGRLVAQKANAFGFRILISDPYADSTAVTAAGATLVSFTDLIAEADIVSLHIPLTTETQGLIGSETMASMKAGAVLVNVSRGGLIDEAALADALSSGHLSAAALDTFATEPVPADHPILSAPNIALSPHAAHFSIQSLDESISKAFMNVAAALRGTPIPYQVNRS